MSQVSNLQSIPVEEARAKVEQIVAAGEALTVETAKPIGRLLDSLGSVTRELFAKYPMVQTKNGGFQLAAAEIHDSEYQPGYISIGHSEDWDVVQRTGSDEVFVVEGSETTESEMDRFPTVYHLILDELQEFMTARR